MSTENVSESQLVTVAKMIRVAGQWCFIKRKKQYAKGEPYIAADPSTKIAVGRFDPVEHGIHFFNGGYEKNILILCAKDAGS